MKELFIKYSYMKSRAPSMSVLTEDWTIIPVPEDFTSLDAVVHFETEMYDKVGDIEIIHVNEV
jgi:hypothetical protein